MRRAATLVARLSTLRFYALYTRPPDAAQVAGCLAAEDFAGP